jgi:protein SCO1
MKNIGFLLAMMAVFVVHAAVGQTERVRPEVGVEEHLGTMIPLDAEFYDEHGNLTPLRAVIDKPTVLMFVYFRCPGICSPLLTEVSRIVDGLDLELGKDYQVVTIGFDHREKFDMAAAKKESYLASMRHKVNPAGWRWFAGDSATIQRVTDSAGFYFKRDGNDYIHAGVLIVLSPTGKITRYMNGVQFLPFDLKMAVVEASEGRTAPTIAKILSFCYRYDPEGRTYALNITRISAILIIVLVAVFVGFFVIRPRKKREER